MDPEPDRVLVRIQVQRACRNAAACAGDRAPAVEAARSVLRCLAVVRSSGHDSQSESRQRLHVPLHACRSGENLSVLHRPGVSCPVPRTGHAPAGVCRAQPEDLVRPGDDGDLLRAAPVSARPRVQRLLLPAVHGPRDRAERRQRSRADRRSRAVAADGFARAPYSRAHDAGAPEGFQRWGIEGALKYFYGRQDLVIRWVEDPEAKQLMAARRVALIEWDAFRKRADIRVTGPG